jgi:U2 small nuclear ribonucleoprotein A'
MSNNRIQRIGPALNESLPQLEMLVLTNNNLTQLPDLDPLAALNGSLRNLSLLDNPVTKKPHYRLYVIHKLPRLRVLDFKKIKYQVWPPLRLQE